LERTSGLKIVTGINTRVRKNFIPVLQVDVIFSDWGCNYIKKNGLGGSSGVSWGDLVLSSQRSSVGVFGLAGIIRFLSFLNKLSPVSLKINRGIIVKAFKEIHV